MSFKDPLAGSDEDFIRRFADRDLRPVLLGVLSVHRFLAFLAALIVPVFLFWGLLVFESERRLSHWGLAFLTWWVLMDTVRQYDTKLKILKLIHSREASEESTGADPAA